MRRLRPLSASGTPSLRPFESRFVLAAAVLLFALLGLGVGEIVRSARAVTGADEAPQAAAVADTDAGSRALTFSDMMHFRGVSSRAISEDGAWVIFETKPDRGDGDVRVVATAGERRYRIERGSGPKISRDGRFVGATLRPAALEVAKGKKKKPKNGMVLLDTSSGERHEFADVKSFAMSRDSMWLARHHDPAADLDGKTDSDEEGEEEEEQSSSSTSSEKPGVMKPSWGEANKKKKQAKAAKKAEGEESESEAKSKAKAKDKKSKKKPEAGTLVLRHLATGRESRIELVDSYTFDPESRALVCVVIAPEPEATEDENDDDNDKKDDDEEEEDDPPADHRLIWIDLAAHAGDADAGRNELAGGPGETFTHLTWVKDRGRMGFVHGYEPLDADGDADDADSNSNDDSDADPQPARGAIETWDAGEAAVVRRVNPDGAPVDWYIPTKNRLRWSRDGDRLFFGIKPLADFIPKDDDDKKGEKDEDEARDSLFDLDTIVAERDLDVWHTDDPRIIPNQKKQWSREKDRVYTSVHHVDSGVTRQLADLDLPDVDSSASSERYLFARSQVPYMREVTWDGSFYDLYVVDMVDGGEPRQIATRQQGTRSLSPSGRFAAFFDRDHWYLHDCESGETRNLTEALDVPFQNEDHDYPSRPGSYGVGGWEAGDAAVYINDKYDIWRFPTSADAGDPIRMTSGAGRQNERQFRIVRQDADALWLEPGEPLLLSAYHDKRKHKAFYRAHVGQVGAEPLLEGDYRLDFVAKAKHADRMLYTRQTYREFPDLWVADAGFESMAKLSDVNPQAKDFAWGNARLVDWTSLDGKPLQGVLITPEGHQPGERLPVIVYFYRFFSQRLHDWNPVVINHRPSFPMYVSNGYAIFLPDIRFEIGRPGLASTKCLVPGVQKLVDMGVADPDAIGLHGHSWSGYQAAFMITQTDIFACCVSGAPVSNMTSAYSGIRLGSGLARQFQYEKTQSRIGGTLWDSLDHYIENSPVFYADRIQTPLLIMFGDVDDAVPWDQGVELHLAMRRLDKECVFLQYRNEPHHPRKYANKLDYSIKMKEYFDHYLKGAPAPEWVTDGVPYRGK